MGLSSESTSISVIQPQLCHILFLWVRGRKEDSGGAMLPTQTAHEGLISRSWDTCHEKPQRCWAQSRGIASRYDKLEE